jgi:hypothetical protein
LEQLEDRALPSNFTALTVSDVIADINAANKVGGTNTITLTAPTSSPYRSTAVNNFTDGANGMPVIAVKDMLTIVGNGDTIEGGVRCFDVAKGASLTLENLTLQGGAFGSGVAAEGGAIYNQGTLVLSDVLVQGSIAQGSDGTVKKNGDGTPGNAAAGGAIWSDGSLTLENGTLLQNNQAIGGNGGDGPGGNGGDASGGGLYVAGGTAYLTGVGIDNNSARSGSGGVWRATLGFQAANAGNAFGGGLYVSSATVNGSGDTLDGNQAIWGINGFAHAQGGGIYVASGTVNLSSDVVENNLANGMGGSDGYDNGGGIYIASGTATLCHDTVENNHAPYGGGIFIGGATVYLDTFTVANTINNADTSGTNGSTANIDGTFILQNC